MPGVIRQQAFMNLTPLEADLLGDLAQDDHALYEIFHFVRHHYPTAGDDEVLRRGRELVGAWVERGWLAVLPEGAAEPVEATEELLAAIDEQGVAGTYYCDAAPRLMLTPTAYRDVDWIRPAV
jgi:hypothetical protein